MIEAARVPLERSLIDARVLRICAWSVALALAIGFVAQALVGIIGLVTNIAFYGRFSTAFVSPAQNHRGWLVLFIPAIGGAIVGLMARYGSKAIRGHGIPEAMEQVLLNESCIPVHDITATHQGFPIVDAAGRLVGVLTRRDFMDRAPDTPLRALIRRPPSVVFDDMLLRDAADHMVREDVGRLPVVDRDDPSRLVGIITRSDLLKVHARRLEEEHG